MTKLAEIVFEMNKWQKLGDNMFHINRGYADMPYQYIAWGTPYQYAKSFVLWIPDFLFDLPDRSVKQENYIRLHYNRASPEDCLRVDRDGDISFHYNMNGIHHTIILSPKSVSMYKDGYEVNRYVHDSGIYRALSYVFEMITESHRKYK